MLFLKYFEPSSTYENKIRAFDTLCEALSLNSKEAETMGVYKRTKLSREVEQKQEKSTFGNRFYDFLSSDKW